MIRLRIPFEIQHGDETLGGEIRFVDACAVERRFHCNLPLEGIVWAYDWFLFGAFCALKRGKRAHGDYDKWLENVEGFRVIEPESSDAPDEAADGDTDEGEDPKASAS